MSELKDKAPMTLAISGGKGGVGKTQVALNLALVMACQGYRTLILDGDLELANVNIMLGIYPNLTLEHVISGECEMEEAVVSIDTNLDMLPGASGVPNTLEMGLERREAFLDQLQALESHYDRVIIDTAAGLSATNLHMIGASHTTALVITPDPTSLTDAFSLLKTLKRKGYQREPAVIVNMAPSIQHARAIYGRFESVAAKYLSMTTHHLGSLIKDERIAQSVTTQKPVMMDQPDTDQRHPFEQLSYRLAEHWSQSRPIANGFARYWRRLIERQVPKDAIKAQTSLDQPMALLRQWLNQNAHDPYARARALGQTLDLIQNQPMDQAMAESLDASLSRIQWDQADEATRRFLADQFRSLSARIRPREGTAPDEARALVGP